MAELSRSGTSAGARTSSRRTRPCASASATSSLSSSETSASTLACASSTVSTSPSLSLQDAHFVGGQLAQHAHSGFEHLIDADLDHAAVVAQRALALVARRAGVHPAKHSAGAGDDGASGVGWAEHRDGRHCQGGGEMQWPAVIGHDNRAVRDGRGQLQHVAVLTDHRYAAVGAGNRSRLGVLAERLRASGYDVVLLTSPGEHAQAGSIASAYGGVPVIGQDGDVLQLAAAISHCSVVVTNDSGPLHLATALAVPSVSMFRPA